MDEHVEHSRRSWLGNFMQQFSWWPPFVRALEFLNNYFLPGVKHLRTESIFLHYVEKLVLNLLICEKNYILHWNFYLKSLFAFFTHFSHEINFSRHISIENSYSPIEIIWRKCELKNFFTGHNISNHQKIFLHIM